MQEPFSGIIQFQGRPIYVYVVRGDVNDLLMYLKWKGKHFNERLIIIAESIRHLELVKTTFYYLKVRVAKDLDLQPNNEGVLKKLHYIDEFGNFSIENE